MHLEKIDEYFESWRDTLNCLKKYDRMFEVLQAYVYGVFCHYFLDRTTHPFVRAQTEALCSVGIEGLEERDMPYVHGQIETDLDVYLLFKLTGRTLEEYCIPKQVLYSSDAALSSIDTLYVSAAELLQIKVPRTLFTLSVNDMRRVEKVLYSPGGTKRLIAGRVERLARRHSLFQTASHSAESQNVLWHANEKRATWHHPDTHERSNKSFEDLFNDALEIALASRALFDTGAPISEITRGLDYYGTSIVRDTAN
jgi:hypothetical protein